MGDMHDAWFFVGIFVFIFLIWIATGGPLHPIAFSGPALNQPEELGGGDYLQLPRSPFTIGSGHTTLSGSSGGGSGYSYQSADSAIPSLNGVAFGTPSPYRGAVTLTHRISNASSTDENIEYVQLSVPQNALPVNISGWQLVSESTGKAGVIPRGALIPTLGVVNATQDIVLAPGEKASIVSGRSPIGTSFRENKCTGHLQTFQKFSPSLPENCPVPLDELSTYYGPYYIRDATCVEYVKKVPRCETVLFPPSELSAACKGFIRQHLNYNGCVADHRTDADFNGRTWHIYLGLNDHLWRARYEIVKLFDLNRKTVDAFSY